MLDPMPGPTVVVTWEDVERRVRTLVAALSDEGVPFERVLAVARGGLVPAALVAAALGVRRVEAVQVRHYDGDRRLDAPVVVDVPTPSDGARTLVVDDVFETGRTIELLRERLPEATYAVLYAKADAGSVWVGARLPADRWIVFPWSGADER
jgi:xanthine phosphoribosyltransferase